VSVQTIANYFKGKCLTIPLPVRCLRCLRHT